ncbi:Transmembrane protein 243 [Manis javanica]|nr:Transmembrane protein 243 [Manis javanica]
MAGPPLLLPASLEPRSSMTWMASTCDVEGIPSDGFGFFPVKEAAESSAGAEKQQQVGESCPGNMGVPDGFEGAVEDSPACWRLRTPSCSGCGGERGRAAAASSPGPERARTAGGPGSPACGHECFVSRRLGSRGRDRGRTYGTGGLDNRPLFGETSAKDRIINLVVGSLTSLLILVTLISAFVFPQLPPKPLNIFFAVCISLSSITACILIYWYRQGDLEPKFRNLIYYILFSIIMLCICANLYFHDVGK